MKATKDLAAKLVPTMIGCGALALVFPAVFSSTVFSSTVQARADDQDDGHEAPAWVQVRDVSYAGSGCPAGRASDERSADALALHFSWDSFTAQTGHGIPLSESRKNCQLTVDLDYPRGWSYAIGGVSLAGYVALEPGVQAQVKAAYYFQGEPQTGTMQTSFYGPDNRDFEVTDGSGQKATVWSPCAAKRALNVNFSASVTSPASGSGGLITLEPGSAPLLTLRWKRCD